MDALAVEETQRFLLVIEAEESADDNVQLRPFLQILKLCLNEMCREYCAADSCSLIHLSASFGR
jgi:hypothetical protein